MDFIQNGIEKYDIWDLDKKKRGIVKCNSKSGNYPPLPTMQRSISD